jgi:soluble lytic murein transglycosylase
MKKNLIIILMLIMVCSFSYVNTVKAYNASNYNYDVYENYIAYRIKYIHSIAYNTEATLTISRSFDYAKEIITWSEHYSRKFNVEIDPLLITAILETETNFVSRGDYDNGNSIGIGSMSIITAKGIANRIGMKYNKWRMLDPLDLGIRFPVCYLGFALSTYNDINKAIVSYNQGLNNVKNKNIDEFYNNYLYKVLGRYNYYKNRINSYDTNARSYFLFKIKQFK